MHLVGHQIMSNWSDFQVCDYHREFYRAENLYLIITGMVEPEQVFKAIEGFEKKIMSKVLWILSPIHVTHFLTPRVLFPPTNDLGKALFLLSPHRKRQKLCFLRMMKNMEWWLWLGGDQSQKTSSRYPPWTSCWSISLILQFHPFRGILWRLLIHSARLSVFFFYANNLINFQWVFWGFFFL